MKKVSWYAVCLVLAMPGCASGPYAVLTSDVGVASPMDVSAVVITGVDGQAYFDDQERRVKPGFHALEVISARKRTRSTALKMASPARQYLYLTVKPCMLYYIVAHHENGAEDAPWKPEVVRAEPIGGCDVAEQGGQDRPSAEQ